VGRNDLPTPPVEIADEVEMYAREHGRHATLHFVPTLGMANRAFRGVWVVRMSLRPNDPRLGLVQTGRTAAMTEDIWLQEPNPRYGKEVPGTGGMREPEFVGLDIEQMGASGVRTFLERGNMWSGRGQYTSLEEQARKARADNDAMKEKFRADQKEASRHEQRDKRRWRFKIPFLGVGIDLGRRNPNKESTS